MYAFNHIGMYYHIMRVNAWDNRKHKLVMKYEKLRDVYFTASSIIFNNLFRAE